MVSRSIWKNRHSWVFQRPQSALILPTRAILIVFEKLTRACFVQIALETMLLPIHTTSHLLDCDECILVQLASLRWRAQIRAKQLSAVANWPRHCWFSCQSVSVRGCLYERGAGPPWRDLTIDYPRCFIFSIYFHINARDIQAAFGVFANKPIVWIITYSMSPKLILLKWLTKNCNTQATQDYSMCSPSSNTISRYAKWTMVAEFIIVSVILFPDPLQPHLLIRDIYHSPRSCT